MSQHSEHSDQSDQSRHEDREDHEDDRSEQSGESQYAQMSMLEALMRGGPACPVPTLVNEKGEGFMDVLTGIRDGLDKQNKVLYKVALLLEAFVPKA